LRGNVDTRLRKLDAGEVDALVLAAAGLERLGVARGVPLEGDPFVPAPGQGTLALQVRTDQSELPDLQDGAPFVCLKAERAVVATLGASCHTPVGVHAEYSGLAELRLRGYAGLPDGSEWILDEVTGSEPDEAARRLAARMLAAGAADLLARAEAAV